MVRFSHDDFERAVASLPPFQGSKGSIVRLKIKDFMTYQDVEMKAGPNVNLIVGPNGTGKSTIVCAICLALAGKPKILGRATNLKQYIRHGATTASVQVELYNSDDPTRNWVVERVITETATTAKSDWFLNGKRSSEAQVETLMESLNIQLDNLCQFLPQDRVQDFALMNKIELLKSTEKSFGHGLAQKHARLEELQEKIKQTNQLLKHHNEKLLTATQQTRNLQLEVNEYYDRQRIAAEMHENEGKKLWLKYKERMVEFTDLRDRCDELKRKKDAEEKQLEPLQKEIKKMSVQLDQFRRKLNALEMGRNTSLEKLKNDYRKAMEQGEKEMSRYNQEYDHSKDQERDRIQRLHIQREKLHAYETELEDFRVNRDHDSNEEALMAEIDEIQRAQDGLNTQIIELEAMEQKDNAHKRMIESRLEKIEEELQTMNQLRSSRLMYLQRKNPEVYKAVEFFFGNRSNQAAFKGEIHEPLILSIFVNDFTYGKVAESCIKSSFLTAFYVEHRDDVEKMIELANKNKIGKISVIHWERPANFRKPRSTLTPDVMRKYDFQKSLIDLIQADDYYMSYLCNSIRPQDIHIGTDKTDRLYEEVARNTNFSVFFTKNKSYKVVKSRYRDNAFALTSQFLMEATVFTDRINALEMDNLLETSARLKVEHAALMTAGSERKVKSDALKVEREQLQTKKNAIKLRIQNKKALENNIIRTKQNIAKIEGEKQDLEQLKKKRNDDILKALKKVSHAQDNYTKGCQKLAETSHELDVLRSQVKTLHDCVMRKTNELDEARAAAQELLADWQKLETQKNAVAEEAQRHRTLAREHSGMNNPPSDVANGKITEEQINASISTLKAQLGFFRHIDEKTIQDFETRKKKIEEMEKTKEEMEKSLSDFQVELEANKKAYLEPLGELIAKINKKFGDFFAGIHCVGEISLDQGEDENDFAKYGVKIMVKFRTSEPLAELCGWKQSGGERAITTALYILSLQELTKVPFRVIDEINQGMDARNERRFFDLLCTLAQGEDTPQYFLLSPKMLPPVSYPENVDFHIILNGPYVTVNDVIEWNGHGGGDDAEESGSEAEDSGSEEEEESGDEE